VNIHEYQAKILLEKFGAPVPRGAAARSAAEFDAALALLPEGPTMVKSQIHAGGRGKGTFTDGYKGGVKFCRTKAEAREAAGRMLGNTLVTVQTGPAGRKVQTVYFTVASGIKHEYYLAVLLDRASSRPVIIASTEGGVEIEKVAHDTPDRILRVVIDPAYGLADYQVRELTARLGLTGAEAKNGARFIRALYALYWETDAAMVEINPLITTPEGEVLALDAKLSFDDNALFRHPEIVALRDLNEEDPKEIEASKAGLSYIALDGNIACLVNGAGLAMSTMDIIKHFGGSPANFLDVGGGASGDHGEHLRRDHGLQRHRPGHRRGRAGGRAQAPPGRPARGQQRRRRQKDAGRFRAAHHQRRHHGRRRPEDRPTCRLIRSFRFPLSAFSHVHPRNS